MKYVISAIAIAAAVSGCATSRAIQGPSGKQAYAIRCGSAVIESCYEEAAKVCPKGYSFADRGSNTPGMVTPMGSGFMVARGPNTMLVECKE